MNDDYSDLGGTPANDYSDLGGVPENIARHQTLPGRVASGALGALNTATAGLGGKGLEKLGVTPEFQRELKEANPISYGVGNVAGLLSPVGEAIGAAGKGAQALVGTRVAGTAAKLATEAALFQTTDEVAKHVMQDPNQSLQTATVNIGLSGLLGGAFGAVGGIAGKGVAKVADSKVGEFLSDFRSRIAEHMAPETTSVASHELNPNYLKFGSPTTEPMFKAAEETMGARINIPNEGIKAAETAGEKAADAFVKSKLGGQAIGSLGMPLVSLMQACLVPMLVSP